MFRPLDQKGQLVVEYVLLLAVAVTIAFLLRKALVQGGDTPAEAGVMLQQWNGMEQSVGADDPNKR